MSSSFPGPPELGRGLVVQPEAVLPEGWSVVARERIVPATLYDPGELLARLHQRWLLREPVVIELGVTTEALKKPERFDEPVWSLEPSFEFPLERLRFLVWANNYDALKGEPVWWHARLAERAGARPHPQAEIDLGGPVWCDGGPRCDLPFPVLHRESIERGRLLLSYPVPQEPVEMELADDQRRAVLHRGGAARILAPAGSGKTRVLTSRLRYLLDCGLEPERITALAYNRRAAQEMLQRLNQPRCQVRTLHALGYGLLRQHRGVRLASDMEVRGLLGSLVRTKAQLNQDPLLPYLEALQRVRLGLFDPRVVEGESEDLPEFASVFARYREALAERNWVDHDEQIYGAIELLLQQPEVRRQARISCAHLLVDEFQDLTPAFLLLVRMLAAPSYQVFGVGDDDQVIYGYAGATPRFLVDFSDYFPGASAYALEVNYRCPSGIVAAAANLLSRNQLRVPKLIRSPAHKSGAPQLLLAPVDCWATRGVEQLTTWLTSCEPEQIAVLARVNALLMPVQVGLRQAGIPYWGTVDGTILKRTGLRTALAYLRLVSGRGGYQAADLAEALRRPNRKLRKELMAEASRCRSFKELARFAGKQDPWPCSQLNEFLSDLALLELRLERGTVAFFRALRTETGFLEALEQLDSGGLGATGSSHRDDLLALEQTASSFPGGSAEDFEPWLIEALEPTSGGGSGLRLSSVHRVKGLEWDRVLIYGVDQGLFPHHLGEDQEEERRIFHVALTRARVECVLLHDPTTASPFLKELSGPGTPEQATAKSQRR